MGSTAILVQATQEGWTDEQVVERVLSGETPLYEVIMRRYNQRLYRMARAILRDDGEAEDVMQDAYVRAYQHLSEFEGRAKFATWLTRIAVNEALGRVRRRTRFQPLETPDESGENLMSTAESTTPSPERSAYDRELGGLLEQAVLQLPEDYRIVFTMREVEEMNTAETAECLGLTEENVKVRLHRARAMLRRELYEQVGAATAGAFQFHAVRCDRVVNQVFRTIAALH
ncbi:MAG TPA: RNA polymerase sigma factor [Candidatus Sulfotelmatobacter sp.]|nr:RNA polymerase sigma factor [Candidatus Sulfotelmatobacter sp.]